MNKGQATLQIGKNGLTEGFLASLKTVFKKYENVKIAVLKNAGHDREKVREMAEKIQSELGNKYTHKIVGFTIFLKKWRKSRQ